MPRTYNKVMLKGEFEQYEALASGALYPGHVLIVDSDGKVKPHNVAGGFAEAIFAIEDSLQGNDIEDQYALNARVQYVAPNKGSVVYIMIKDGENIAKGDKLVSAGDGKFQEAKADSSSTVMEEHIMGVALDNCDMSSSSGADASGWCRMRVA